MEETIPKVYKLNEALKAYLKYNESFMEAMNSIQTILDNETVTKDDYNILSQFQEFEPLYIYVDPEDGLDADFVANAVYNIFSKCIDDVFHYYDLADTDTENYSILLRLLVASEYDNAALLRGLKRVSTSVEEIENITYFYEEELMSDASDDDEPIDDIIDLAAFMKGLDSCKDDRHRLDEIIDEIKRVKINSLKSGRDSFSLEHRKYVRALKQALEIYQINDDGSISSSTKDIDDEDIDSADGSGGSASNNKHHTMMRKALALYYILNEVSDSLLDDGNKRAVARFFSFLTGNNESNIYKSFPKMYEGLDNPNSSRRRDFEFVIAELEKIGLGTIAKKMKRDMD